MFRHRSPVLTTQQHQMNRAQRAPGKSELDPGALWCATHSLLAFVLLRALNFFPSPTPYSRDSRLLPAQKQTPSCPEMSTPSCSEHAFLLLHQHALQLRNKLFRDQHAFLGPSFLRFLVRIGRSFQTVIRLAPPALPHRIAPFGREPNIALHHAAESTLCCPLRLNVPALLNAESIAAGAILRPLLLFAFYARPWQAAVIDLTSI